MPPAPYSLIFMGTPHFALPSLKALHEAGYPIRAVYSQPPRPAGRGQKDTPSPVHAYALEQGLKILTPTSLKTPEAQAEFKSHEADLAVVIAYGMLLPPPILAACRLGCINVHPSALPRWRGAAPLQRTIMAGDESTALIIMQMEEGLDTGPALLSEDYAIPLHTTSGQLHDTMAAKAGPLLLKTLLQLESLTPQAQSAEGVTYAAKITKEEAALNFTRPAKELYHHILGLSPTPGAHFQYQGQAVKILDARFDPTPHTAAPGTVLDDALTIACSAGRLIPIEIQWPGKKRLPTADVLRGHPIPPGTVLS